MKQNRHLFLIILLSFWMSACTHHQQQKVSDNAFGVLYYFNQLEEKSVKLNNIEINYLEREGSGPTLLLLHGFSADRNSWIKLAQKLPNDYRLIIPDLAGHGKTKVFGKKHYDFFTQSKHIQALMQYLGHKRYHIAGHSMGGGIALLYSITYCEQIQSLILIDNAGVKAPNPSAFMHQVNTHYQEDKNPLIATTNEQYKKRWSLISKQPPFIPWPVSSVMKREHFAKASTLKQVFKDMLGMRKTLPEQEIKKHLQARLKYTPVLIIWGEEDAIIDVSSTETLQEYIPHSELVIFKNVGHTPITEAPKQTAVAIGDFIKKTSTENKPK